MNCSNGVCELPTENSSLTHVPSQVENIYTIYGAPGCSWCDKAINWMEEKELEYNYFESTECPRTLIPESHKTVPIIFKGQEFIGGFSDLS